jgi:hypothetical protein
MAKSPKLKVFRTPIGFHDAYVAAPSQKAALEAWGASANLFARGVAEVVTDPKLTRAPLASPGEVIKVARGTAAEHIAALPKARVKTVEAKAEAKPDKAAKPKPKPRPKRDKLDAAEAALAELESTQRAERREMDRREAELRRERAALEKRQEGARAKLEDARVKAERAYRDALERWRG